MGMYLYDFESYRSIDQSILAVGTVWLLAYLIVNNALSLQHRIVDIRK